ncbi:MAG: RcnB family protein [Pseudomonadota bacterium]|uniref:RcnB family protein n=1 Tax=Sphingobium sp. TaxID=1912891 RepID=UPI002E1E095D
MFKKILMSLAATTMVASPMIASQAQAAPHRENVRIVERGPHARTVVKQKTVVRNNYRAYNNRSYGNGHRWAKGQRFDRRYATNYRVINNYRDYRLAAPPRGYQYVRSGNDAVLVAITSGIIGAVIGSAIR